MGKEVIPHLKRCGWRRISSYDECLQKSRPLGRLFCFLYKRIENWLIPCHSDYIYYASGHWHHRSGRRHLTSRQFLLSSRQCQNRSGDRQWSSRSWQWASGLRQLSSRQWQRLSGRWQLPSRQFQNRSGRRQSSSRREQWAFCQWIISVGARNYYQKEQNQDIGL